MLWWCKSFKKYSIAQTHFFLYMPLSLPLRWVSTAHVFLCTRLNASPFQVAMHHLWQIAWHANIGLLAMSISFWSIGWISRLGLNRKVNLFYTQKKIFSGCSSIENVNDGSPVINSYSTWFCVDWSFLHPNAEESSRGLCEQELLRLQWMNKKAKSFEVVLRLSQ